MRKFIILSLFVASPALAGQIAVGRMEGGLPLFRATEEVSSVKTELHGGEAHLVVYGKSKSFPSCYISYELLRKNAIDRVAFVRTLLEKNSVVVQCAADDAAFASDILLKSL